MASFRCHECGTSFDAETKTSRCRPCLDAVAERSRTRRAYLKAQRLCNGCGSADVLAAGETARCEICYFRDAAKKTLGSRVRWQELHVLWQQQKGICPYTGRELQLGVDATVDHILPISRFLIGSTTSRTLNGCITASMK